MFSWSFIFTLCLIINNSFGISINTFVQFFLHQIEVAAAVVRLASKLITQISAKARLFAETVFLFD